MTDPTPFNPAAWGIMGILAFVIAGLLGIVWRLFNKMGTDQAKRDEVLMGFVNAHRGETSRALEAMGAKINESYRDLKSVFEEQIRHLERQGVMLNEILAAQKIVTELGRLRREGGREVTHEDLEGVVRGVIGELRMRPGEGR